MNNKIKTLLLTSSLLSMQIPTQIQGLEAQAAQSGKAMRSKAAGATAKQVKEKTRFGKVEGSGMLTAMLTGGRKLGECPLQNTEVKARISGYVSRVTVKQTFKNTFNDKIEAVYTFPLSQSAAVDAMTMKVGERIIKGSIKKREEAKRIYEAARHNGQVASLLEQERPNIFTQSVANIEPGKSVEVTIEYIDLLPFEDGKYSFSFPTVVGPRFVPNSEAVTDSKRISPPITPKGTRAGHDIAIDVSLDASMPVSDLKSMLHEVTVKGDLKGKGLAEISLVGKKTIPNKDFVLSWQVAGDAIKSGALTYRDPQKDLNQDGSGYFTLMLVPPEKVTQAQAAPKEMVFLIDCSGSQNGKPLDKAKETMNYAIDHMNPRDTFQIITFNNTSQALFDQPRMSSPEMKEKAKRFIKGLTAHGGTWMAPAVERVCQMKAPENRLRIVSFMTDGYVGNDMEILGLVRKLRGKSRWFPFGTGNSVNRFLIDGIAREGGGEPEYVLLNSKADEVGKRFYSRIATPVLTDVKVDIDGVAVKEVYPRDVADVWARKPLYIKGRYLKPGAGTVTLSGFQAGRPYKQILKVNFPESATANEGIASVWARAKVDRLMAEGWTEAQRGQLNKELKEEIEDVALKHHIMTQYTAFVAVEEKTVTQGGEPKRITVPVEMPDGVSREGVFGTLSLEERRRQIAMPMASPAPMARGTASSLGGARFHYSPNRWSRSLSTSTNMKMKGRPTGGFLMKKAAADKAYNVPAKSESVSKFDTTLENLIKQGKVVDSGSLILDGDRVKVEVTLSGITKVLEKQLEQAGLVKLERRSGARIVGYIKISDLKKLAALGFVQSVRAVRK
ncbi:MAG: VWA domain-containing protein [Candidatus Obscuribacterales bacterium]|nr:VWA domain-containing protein [Candidatus Obscuribacterales bacterium]